MRDGNHEDVIRVHAEEHVERETPHRALVDVVSQNREDERALSDTVLCTLDRAKETPPKALPASLIQPCRFENLVVRLWVVDEIRHLRANRPARARSCTWAGVRPFTRPDRSSS